MRRISLFSALVFLAFWALRIRAVEPAFYPDDSPETAAAGCLAGIQHPPGYPLPSLLGRLESLALPGAPAIAQNFGAAAFACLTLALFFAVAWTQARGGPWLAAALSLGLALMPQLAYQAASAKGGIYTLNALLTLACLACFFNAKKNPKLLYLGSLVWGLGLAGHYMSLLLFAPAVLLWVRGVPKRRLPRAAFWLLPGLSLYLYLPLRAAWHPALNWGDPETLGRFWDCLTRAQYASGASSRGTDSALRLAGHFFTLLPGQFPWFCWPLALGGAWNTWKKHGPFKPLLAALGLHWLAVVLYNNPPAADPWVINAFFLPDFIGLWWLALLGAQAFPSPQRRWLAPSLALAFLALAPAKLAEANYSNDYLCYDYSQDLLEGLPKNTVLLAAGGGDAFGVWYLQTVQARRSDVVLLDALLLTPWYLEQLRPKIGELRPEWADKDSVVNGLLQANMARPLYYSTHNPGDRGIPLGVHSLAPAPMQKVALNTQILAAPWAALRTRFLDDKVTPDDADRREMAQYYVLSAQALETFAKQFNSQPLQAYAMTMKKRFSLGSPK